MFRIFRLFLSLILSGAAVFIFYSMRGSSLKFTEGEEYTFYVGSLSSDAEIITVYGDAVKEAEKLPDIRGESTVYSYSEELISLLEEKYSAEKIFTESCCGRVGSYYYSPLFSTYVVINGYAINLHIVTDGVKIKIGSPIIFGGY